MRDVRQAPIIVERVAKPGEGRGDENQLCGEATGEG